jgi:hypothetical protein
MRPREIFTSVGLAVALVGLAVGLIAALEACGSSQERDLETGASTVGQVASQPQLPPLDLAAPVDFQTATFSLG